MSKKSFALSTALICLCLVSFSLTSGKPASSADWSFNATFIEACSCPMFCQCFFNAEPAGHASHGGHGEEHFCKFNIAAKVEKGHFGDVQLDGAKFWVTGDLGSDFSDGKMDWLIVTFDKSLTPEQREGLGAILGHVYPVEWSSFETREGTIDRWTHDKDSAHATLDGGKGAEIKLKRAAGMSDDPIVVKNLKYWGAARNDGFVLMPNEVEAYRLGDKAFEFRGTTGFMITLDMNSGDLG